jgi:hypothetical protein
MKECCKVPENLSESVAPNPEKPELTVRECVCGAKHYELDADALQMGVFGADL